MDTPTTKAPARLTTNALMDRVTELTGKECKSRNRPALLKKLGMPAEETTKKSAKKAKKSPPVVEIDGAAFIKKAMARKSPPSLRALCAELTEAKVAKPRGGTDWLPSSLQNILRQLAVK